MISHDGTVELTYKQLQLFHGNAERIAHSRMSPAQKAAALTIMCEAFRHAPPVDDVKSVIVELPATRLAQLSGLSESTAGECAQYLENYGMRRSTRREQVTGGKYVTQVLVETDLALPQLPQTRSAPTPRAQKMRDAAAEIRRLADRATEMLNTPCPVCGAVGDWHLHCHSCGATWTAEAAAEGAQPDIDTSPGDYVTEGESFTPGENAEKPTIDPTERLNSPYKDFSTTRNSPFGETAPGGTTLYDSTLAEAVAAPAPETAPNPLPPAEPYAPGPGDHPNPLINVMGTEKRFLPCRVIPQPGDKPKKLPLRCGPDGKPKADGWQEPVGWMTFYAAETIAPSWGAQAFSIQFGGAAHDLAGVDLDKCLADGSITSERAAQIVAFLDTYTTISVSGTGLHPWLIDRTHLIPQKLDESDGIGIYRSSKHFCETLQSFGPVLSVRVIDDPAEARTICRVLGVVPTDEQVIAPPMPSHAPARGTTDRLTWAVGLLSRLSPGRCDDYGEWIRVGMSLAEFGEVGLAEWDRWSTGSAKYKPGDCERRWKSFKPSSGITLGSLYQWAKEDDPR